MKISTFEILQSGKTSWGLVFADRFYPVADNLDDIAADWHSWSRLMHLPMLLIDNDNIASPVRRQLGLLMVEAPIDRRKRITLPKHRPWFLRRRKIGSISKVEKLCAAEIIARH